MEQLKTAVNSWEESHNIIMQQMEALMKLMIATQPPNIIKQCLQIQAGLEKPSPGSQKLAAKPRFAPACSPTTQVTTYEVPPTCPTPGMPPPPTYVIPPAAYLPPPTHAGPPQPLPRGYTGPILVPLQKSTPYKLSPLA